MAATLTYQGIRITVPTDELAEAIRQLKTLASPPPEPELFHRPPELELAGYQGQFATPGSDEELALSFLRTIAAHPASGAPPAAVMAALGAAHPKGVGSKTAVVNRLLDMLGFATPDVYTNPRDSFGERLWKGGPRLQEAIAMVEYHLHLTTHGGPSRDEDLP